MQNEREKMREILAESSGGKIKGTLPESSAENMREGLAGSGVENQGKFLTDSSRNQGQDKHFLDEALLDYVKSNKYPFHMPGHKRRRPEEWIPGEEKKITKTGIGKCQIAESPGLCATGDQTKENQQSRKLAEEFEPLAAGDQIRENQQTQRSTQEPGTGAANEPTAASSRYISWSPEQIDITEIDGFDNLHHAEGILKEGQERLAALFGADKSYYLVNGSTAGILAAVCACAPRGSRILIARNCHKSVYHAVRLRELRTEYVYPQETDFGIQGSIDPEEVRRKLEEFPDTAAVVITSPTYDGVVSDIRAIAQAVHGRGIPLIVDSAHGAHFGFSGMFPEKAITLGADIAVESLHKTLPSFTQTAVLHIQKTVSSPRKQEFYRQQAGASDVRDAVSGLQETSGKGVCMQEIAEGTQEGAPDMRDAVSGLQEASGKGACMQEIAEGTQAEAPDMRDAETSRQVKEWSAQSAPKGTQRSWRILPEQIEQYLDIFQTSSPSYILMAGIDRCVRLLVQDGERLFAEFEARLLRFYKKCAGFRYVEVLDAVCFAGAEGKERAADSLRLLPSSQNTHKLGRTSDEKQFLDILPGRGIFGRDISKVLISAARAGMTGQELYDLLLHKYHLQMEMASGHYVAALTSVMDTEEGFDRLYEALAEIENTAASRLECNAGATASFEGKRKGGLREIENTATSRLECNAGATASYAGTRKGGLREIENTAASRLECSAGAAASYAGTRTDGLHENGKREGDHAGWLEERTMPLCGDAAKRIAETNDCSGERPGGWSKATPVQEEDLQMSFFTPLSLYALRKKSMEIAEALELPKKRVRLEAAAGMVSADFLCLYPPGIPIIAPGEWITEEVVALLAACRSRGMQLTGLADADNRTVWVLDKA